MSFKVGTSTDPKPSAPPGRSGHEVPKESVCFLDYRARAHSAGGLDSISQDPGEQMRQLWPNDPRFK